MVTISNSFANPSNPNKLSEFVIMDLKFLITKSFHSNATLVIFYVIVHGEFQMTANMSYLKSFLQIKSTNSNAIFFLKLFLTT